MKPAGFYKDKKKTTRPITPPITSFFGDAVSDVENAARRSRLRKESKALQEKRRAKTAHIAEKGTLDGTVEAARVKPISEFQKQGAPQMAPIGLGPKGRRLVDKYDTKGARLVAKFDLDKYNQYTVWEKDGKYFMWLDTPLGFRVTNFGKDEARMEKYVTELKQNIDVKQMQRAEKELKGKRAMAALIAKDPAGTADTRKFLASEISREFLSDGQFKAFQKLFWMTHTKGDPADNLLLAYINKEAQNRGL